MYVVEFEKLNQDFTVHIAKVYYIGGYRKYDFLFLPTAFIIKVLA